MIRARVAGMITAGAALYLALTTIAVPVAVGAGGSIEGTYSVSNSVSESPTFITAVTVSSLTGGAYQVVGHDWEGIGFYEGGDYWGVFRDFPSVGRSGVAAAGGTHRGQRQPDGSIRVHGVSTDGRVGAFDEIWHPISEIGLRKSTDSSGTCSYIEQLPRPVKRVPPKWPEGYSRPAEGAAIVLVLVGTDGRVDSTKVLLGMGPWFDISSKEAARQWVFEPAVSCGVPVEVWWAIPFSFRQGTIAAPPPRSTPSVPRGEPPVSPLDAPLKNEGLPQLGDYVYVEELPEALTKVEPVYPPRERQIDGTVIVQALVGRDGRVKDTRVLKSVPLLDDAAVAAVRQWVFKPAMSGGKPVAVWVAIPVRFSAP